MVKVAKLLIGVFICMSALSNNMLTNVTEDIYMESVEKIPRQYEQENKPFSEWLDVRSFEENPNISDVDNEEIDIMLRDGVIIDEFVQNLYEISDNIAISLIEEIGLIHVQLPSEISKEEFLNNDSIQSYIELQGELPQIEVPQNPLDKFDFNLTIERTEVERNRSTDERQLFNDMAWHVDEVTSNGESLQISKGKGIKIAVIDSGVDDNHPILSGRIDTLMSKSYVTDDTEISDENGHGTAVAGIITQIAPEATLTSYKVIGKSTGDSEWTIEALIQAADDGNDIINMSLGTYKCVDMDSENMTILAFERAVEYAESKSCIVVASAGNNGLNLDDYFQTEHMKHLPGCMNGVITVSAANSNSLASYSNYGSEIDICAPGGDLVYVGDYIDLSKWIYCLYPTTMDNGLTDYGIPQGYSFSYGTSLSAPAVSAALADIHAMDTDMECQETISYLKNGAVDLGIAGTDIQFGSGKINLKASLNLVDN